MRSFGLLLALGMTLGGQDDPPTTQEVARAFESKVSNLGARILFWEKRTSAFTVRDVRGWSIRFKHLIDETGGSVLKRRHEAIGQKSGVCHEYSVIQVLPIGPPPHALRCDVQVENSGQTACK